MQQHPTWTYRQLAEGVVKVDQFLLFCLGTLAFCPVVPIVRSESSTISSGEKSTMEDRPREDALKRTPLKPLTTDDYSPMRPSDNPLVALAE